ncbi:unnamed protein product [Symbiodinium microadriaticum]|nr:unnamed protein product [Symbiodinium microadriaticum]
MARVAEDKLLPAHPPFNSHRALPMDVHGVCDKTKITGRVVAWAVCAFTWKDGVPLQANASPSPGSAPVSKRRPKVKRGGQSLVGRGHIPLSSSMLKSLGPAPNAVADAACGEAVRAALDALPPWDPEEADDLTREVSQYLQRKVEVLLTSSERPPWEVGEVTPPKKKPLVSSKATKRQQNQHRPAANGGPNKRDRIRAMVATGPSQEEQSGQAVGDESSSSSRSTSSESEWETWVTIRVGFDVESPAQALLEACRLRSRMGALCTIREPDGVTLDLSDPVRDQISDGVLRLIAEAAPGRAAASTSPPGEEESSVASGAAAQPCPAQPVPMEGSEAAKEPASASSAGPVEAPPAGEAVKTEDEGARKPLLSDDCCTCYACNISVRYKEMTQIRRPSKSFVPVALSRRTKRSLIRELCCIVYLARYKSITQQHRSLVAKKAQLQLRADKIKAQFEKAVQDLADVSKEIEQAEGHLVKVQTQVQDQLKEAEPPKVQDLQGLLKNAGVTLTDDQHVALSAYIQTMTQPKIDEEMLDLGEGVAQVWPQLSEAALTGPRYFPVDFEPWEEGESGVIQEGDRAKVEEMVCKASEYLVPGTDHNLAGL